MIVVSVSAPYPEKGEYDWREFLGKFVKVGAVEVGFMDPFLFQRIDFKDILLPFTELHLKASSVHMAHAPATNFELFYQTLKRTIYLAKELDVRFIVVHPGRKELPKCEILFELINPLLEKFEVVLCWETFETKKRSISNIENLVSFCKKYSHHRICYDISHFSKPQEEIIADIERYSVLIKCMHISNKLTINNKGRLKRHLPLLHPEGEFRFEEILKAIKNSDFSGNLVLEYSKEYFGYLLKDALWIKHELRG